MFSDVRSGNIAASRAEKLKFLGDPPQERFCAFAIVERSFPLGAVMIGTKI